jgi:hypothetical protein
VYASSDTGCTTPLNGSALSVTVSGDGNYTSPDFTPSSTGSFKWVATYSGDANNVALSTSCADPNEVSTVSRNGSPSIQVVKLEMVAGSGGGFVRGPLTVNVGSPGHYIVHTIDYEIQVSNTGNVPLTLSLHDRHCDAGTIQGPVVITGTLNGVTLSPGGQAQYTCSHRLLKSDPGVFTNTATVIGKPPSGPPVHGTSHVTVKKHSHPGGIHSCRSVKTGKPIKYHGNRKPKACRPQKPHNPNGFTG